MGLKKALFIDRDGTIIVEPQPSEQVDSFEKFEFVPGAISALKNIAGLDYELVLATNQDGLGTESFPYEDFIGPQELMLRTLRGEGVVFDDILIDDSFPEDNKPTRKPGIGMFGKYLSGEYDLAASFVIGDRATDMQLAANLGCQAILLIADRVGNDASDQVGNDTSDQVGNDASDQVGNDASDQVGNDTSDQVGNDASDQVGNDTSDQVGNDTSDQVGNDASVMPGLTGHLALNAHAWSEIAEFLRKGERRATVSRNTKETQITVTVDLDGRLGSSISTGLNFFDHMLDQIAHHSGIGLQIDAKGDLQVDEHHTMEDVAIALGEALKKALGNKRGIGRYGFALPMDECEAMVLMDLGGRIDFAWDVPFTREYVGDTPTEMFRHFYKSLCEALQCNLHIRARGENNHHLAEAVFKAFARALRQAVACNPFDYELPSSKGLL